MPASCDTFMADNMKEINEKEAVATLHFNWYIFIAGWIDVTDDESISFNMSGTLSLERGDLEEPYIATNNSRGKEAKNGRPLLNNFR